MAQKRLMQELQALYEEKWVNIEYDLDNLFTWKIGLWVVNPDSVWHGAFLKCEMKFRNDYPYQPPKFRFLTQRIHHPNVYPSGELCISILHRPGEDRFSGEAASERWNVLHGVESVLRSVLLLLDDPEINSAANVDASVKYRDDRPLYDELARNVVKQSLEGLPSDVRMPTEEELRPKPQKVEEDDDFWTPSDEDDFESSFGGSDSDADMDELEDDDDDEDENKDESK